MTHWGEYIVIITVLGALIYLLTTTSYFSAFFLSSVPTLDAYCIASSKSGTSGQLFTGATMRKYPRSLYRFNNAATTQRESTIQKTKPFFNYTKPKSCENWVVVTTIFLPSISIQKAAKLQGWCIVVVADRKSSLSYHVDNIVYLTVKDQEKLADQYKFIRQLPWNHFGRKNIGYFYAIVQNAQYIFDLDDDNVLKHTHISLPENLIEITSTNSTALNIYSIVGASQYPCWPRGFPLQRIKEMSSWSSKLEKVRKNELLIFQSLADNDPDVDAIYRMVLPLPFTFSTNMTYGIPKGVFVPYNAQASVHYYRSFWGLLLPITVHGRVSDIWRSYITQRLLWNIGGRIAFTPPWVNQYRNPHNYIQDFQAETDLYLKTNALIELLAKWKEHENTLPGLIEELWIEMYERNYINIEDVELVQGWLDILLRIGYRFPTIV